MNKRIFGFMFLVLVVFFAGIFYSNSLAEAKKAKCVSPAKVGVVNVRLILQSTKKHAEFMNEMQQEMQAASDELKMLAEELKTDEKAMETRIKGSPDYFKMAKDLMVKEAQLNARNEFQKNLMALKEKQWTEKLYAQINEKIAEVAKEMGVDIVLDGNADITKEIPAVSPNELVLTIRTRKVLYFSDAVDITQEVLEAVDSK